MTADAKVGLLLGLTFIVIIAFLVNGLPNFFGGKKDHAAIDTSIPEPQPSIVIPAPVDYGMRLAEAPPLRQMDPPTDSDSFEIPSAASQTPSTPTMETPEPPRKVTRYKVSKGDYVINIAAKIYGPEIGRKPTTIAAIVKANKLPAPYVIQIGQILEMPDLSRADQRSTLLSMKLFEKAKKVVKDTLGKNKIVEYTVKDGDCLSMISAKHLGTCKRVDEILKLNKDHIDSADDIVAGMVLKLPKL
jgi:nucleoid-associated protein YgaU